MTNQEASSVAARYAVADAAANAAKTGIHSSELWTTIGAGVVSLALVALKAAAVIPGPWSVPAGIAALAIGAATYNLSRGNVKAAALEAAMVVARDVIAPPPPTAPGM